MSGFAENLLGLLVMLSAVLVFLLLAGALADALERRWMRRDQAVLGLGRSPFREQRS